MSLKITEATTLSGTSTINGIQVATFSAEVSAGQAYQSVGMNIVNQDLYDANKAEVRKDRDDFQDKVDALTDELDTEAANENTSTQPATTE
ncbi:hypothetical protein [Pediococcus claussenii]|uniref:hypothetical protein n=1 Tax=Pediococcus claussenii TaxID=187452 RepID=UPI00081A7566|nr:hypothetical protein [Pediococcus claussenii]ANZ70382.1 hypothetical protein AYR57_08660 [Pediococcus claussenii]ANZ72198.1 hypothetical protein AYR58_08660 [Pediococcus claussenii]